MLNPLDIPEDAPPTESPPPYSPYAQPGEQVVEEGAHGWNNPPRLLHSTVGTSQPQVTAHTNASSSNSNVGSGRLNHRPSLPPRRNPFGNTQTLVSMIPERPRPPPSISAVGGRAMPWCWKCDDTGYKRRGMPCNRCPRGEAVRLGLRTCPQCFTAPRTAPRGPCPHCGAVLPPSVWDAAYRRNNMSSVIGQLASISLGGPLGATSTYPYGGVGGGYPATESTTGHFPPPIHYGYQSGPSNMGRLHSYSSMNPQYSARYNSIGRSQSGNEPVAGTGCLLCRSRRELTSENLMPSILTRHLPERCPACNAVWRPMSSTTPRTASI
ncbi:hypothetical protein IWQ62_000538 [Dispira parvispora]|uniref:Uncharacterized protein n=1 Tax=Dispira parvispora TaxID=1520584 RepID=A0A9W8AUH8_9FUNG|nr:hypothetical protein IWQ62_000538 [Dispira parvispora]